MDKKRVTVKDVAKAAGVSLMTVSRAINGQDGISDETRSRILDLVKQMDYHPSQIARSLATRQTNTLGLVVPDVANPFFASIARGAEDEAYEHDLGVFLINSAETVEREQAALDSLWQKEVNGVILCSSRLPQPRLRENCERFSRMVLVNRNLDLPIPNVFTINVDDEMGAEMIVRHFLASGRKHLALIAGPESSQSGQRRKVGFQRIVHAAGLPLDDSHIQHCPPTLQGGMEAARQLFDRHAEIDAISAYNDLVAIGTLQELKTRGKIVPQDVAVVGVDDVPLAALVQPTLSTLKVDQYEIGRMAVRFFLANSNSNLAGEQNYVIQPVLVQRESS